MSSVEEIFGDIPAKKPEENKQKSKFRRIDEEDQTPQPIDINHLEIDKKAFIVGGDKLTDDIKNTLLTIIPALNMKDYKLRTRTMSKDEFNQYFEKSIINKEIYLPWKSFNNSVESIIDKMTEEAYNVACWMETSLYKNTTVDKFNSYKPIRKTMLANEVYIYLGKDLNTKPAFAIIDTPCGSTTFTKDTDYENINFNVKRVLSVTRLLNIKVYNVRNVDSMNELNLLLQS